MAQNTAKKVKGYVNKMNLHCGRTDCDNNTGLFDKICMHGITADSIRHAKSDKPMCEYFRKQILQLENEFREVFDNE